MKTVAIVDYGMGNVDSVVRAIEDCGAVAKLTADAATLSRASHVVLPGVGAFRDGMEHLRDRGLDAVLKRAATTGTPILGICLGMQLLATRGSEGGNHDGLGLIEADVLRLEPNDSAERVPHVGWNSVVPRRDGRLLSPSSGDRDFYFVHSYHVVCADESSVVATTPYCGEFASIIERDNILGTQFHPEKSQRAGFALLRSFLAI